MKKFTLLIAMMAFAGFSNYALSQTITGSSVCEGSTLSLSVVSGPFATYALYLVTPDNGGSSYSLVSYGLGTGVIFDPQTAVGYYEIWKMDAVYPAPNDPNNGTNPTMLGNRSIYSVPTNVTLQFGGTEGTDYTVNSGNKIYCNGIVTLASEVVADFYSTRGWNISYDLYKNAALFNNKTSDGSGETLTWTGLEAGTYTVKATRGECIDLAMSGNPEIMLGTIEFNTLCYHNLAAAQVPFLDAVNAAANGAAMQAALELTYKVISSNEVLPFLVLTNYNTLVAGRQLAVGNDMFSNKAFADFAAVEDLFNKMVDFRLAVQVAVNNGNAGTLTIAQMQAVNDELADLENYTVNGQTVTAQNITDGQAGVDRLSALDAGRYDALVADLAANGPYPSFQAMGYMLNLLLEFREAVQVAVDAANAGSLVSADFLVGGKITNVLTTIEALPNGTLINGTDKSIIEAQGDAAIEAFNNLDEAGKTIVLAAMNSSAPDSFTELLNAAMIAYNGLLVVNTSYDPDRRYGSIQGALDLALENHTIVVGTGTFDKIVIDVEGLTIQNGSSPIIDGGGSGTVVTITANNVTFQGFTVQNSGATASDAGIAMQNVTGCTVQTNIVTNNANGIVVAYGSGNTIKSNNVNTIGGYGVVLAGSSGNTVELNNISGVSLDALVIENNNVVGGDGNTGSNGNFIKTNTVATVGRDGLFIGDNCTNNSITDINNFSAITSIAVHVWRDGAQTITDNVIGSALVGIKLRGTDGSVVTGNTISGNGTGIEMERYYSGGTWYPCQNNTISSNDISGNTTYGMYAVDNDGVVIVAENNWWGNATGPYHATFNTCGLGNAVQGNVDFSPWLDDVQGTGSPVYAPVVNSTQGTFYCKIQEAINAANDSDVIEVAAGTYSENLSISKPITLLGANANIPYVDVSRVAESVIQPSSPGYTPISLSGAGVSDNVTINGFEITGNMSNYGIYCGQNGPSNLNIKFNYIHDIGINRGSGNIYAIAYHVHTDVINTTDINISDNYITNVANTTIALKNSAGIWFGQSTGNGTISNVIIQNNIIKKVYSAKSNQEASGIYLGVAWGAGTGSLDSPLIKENTITEIQGTIAYGIQLSGKIPGAQVTNNVIDNINGLSANPSYAFGVAVPVTNTGSATVVMNNNSITNVPFAILNGTANTIDGTCNWFGSDQYTNIFPKVTGPIVYVPYLLSSDLNGACGGGPAIPDNLTVTYTASSENIVVAFDVTANELELQPVPGLDPNDPNYLADVAARYQALATATTPEAIQAAALAIGDDIITEYYYMDGTTKVYLETAGGNELVKSKYWSEYLVREGDNERYPVWTPGSELTLIEQNYEYRTSTNPNTDAVVNGWLNPVLGRDLHVQVTFLNNGYVNTINQTVAIDRGPVNVYSASPTGPGNWVSSHTTIQEGIDAFTTLDNYVIVIDDGTYEENITIDKPLTIAGESQAGTIIIPALSAPNPGGGGSIPAGSSNVIFVQANDVSIQNLTVDGDNPGLTSGIVHNSADIDARNGIITNHGAGTFNNLKVDNVLVKNIYLRGIYPSTGGSFTISNNTVINVNGESASIAIMNWAGTGSFTDNTVSNSNDGIVSNHSKGVTYSGNNVSFCGTGIHTDNNTTSADQIINNNIDDCGYGIFVFAPYVDVLVSDNTVLNSGVGLCSAGSYSATPLSVSFTNNLVDGQNNANSVGIYSTTEIWGFASGNQDASFSNNFIQNTANAFLLASEDGFTNSTTVFENSITGNTLGVKLVNDYTEIPPTGVFSLTMSCNWWGSDDAYDVQSAVAADVNFLPFLSNGTDNQPGTIGFQPVPNSCDGYGPVIVYEGATTNVRSSHMTIPAAYNAAVAEDVIEISAGTYQLTEEMAINKSITIQGQGWDNTTLEISSSWFDNPNIDQAFDINAVAGDVTIKDIHFKVVGKGQGSILRIFGSNRQILNNKFSGEYVFGEGQVTRATEWSAGSGITFSGNIVESLRQPGYINNGSGTISNNTFSTTKGWLIVETFTGTLDITNNTFGHNASHITILNGANVENLTINYNDLSGALESGGWAIDHRGNDLLSATCNWWGTVVGNDIAPKNTGDVDYSPWLISGNNNAVEPNPGFVPDQGSCGGSSIEITSATPTDAICGFPGQIEITFKGGVANYTVAWGTESESGVTTSPYTITGLSAGSYTITVTDANGTVSYPVDAVTVDYLPVTNTTSNTHYATITAAIAAANPSDVIELCAGDYTENLVVNKSLTINGPNAGKDPNVNSRDPEAVLLDGTLNVTGNTVVIDGIKVHQTNNDLDAVLLAGPSVVTFQNSIIERFGVTTGVGARGLTTSAGPGLKTIQNNLFTGDGLGGFYSGHKTWNSGMYVNGGSSTLNIQNNVFENCRTAINLDDYNANIALSGNTFQNSGTLLAFGGSSPTDGSYTLGTNDFKPLGTFINLSNVSETFRLDITSSKLNGTVFSDLDLATLFNIEAAMYHRSRSNRKGLVYFVADHVYVRSDINNDINTAIGYAAVGDVVLLNTGTYNQNVLLNNSVTVQGQGPDKTILTPSTSCSGIGVTISADNALLKDLKVTAFLTGIAVSATGNEIDNVEAVLNCNQGLELSNGVTTLSVLNSKFNDNTSVGVRKGTASIVDGFTMENCEVTGNNQGFFIAKNNGTGGTFDNVRQPILS